MKQSDALEQVKQVRQAQDGHWYVGTDIALVITSEEVEFWVNGVLAFYDDQPTTDDIEKIREMVGVSLDNVLLPE